MSPDIVPDASQGGKPCWNCPEVIPYSKGWCDDCWNALGEARQGLIFAVGACLDRTLIGRVFSAVSDSLREERRPKPEPYNYSREPKPVFGKRARVSLDDLEIKI